MVTTWNCRGLSSLNGIHPDFDGYGVSDSRLNEHSELVCGGGGVGLMWRKSLHATPLTNLGSDRICAIQLSLTSSLQRTSMHIICAYLPSSDHTFEEYRKYVGDLVSIISTLEPYGPLILVGDLNAHLNAPTNKQGDLVLEAIRNCNLFIASSSCIAKGPGYTFFNTNRKNCRGLYTYQHLY